MRRFLILGATALAMFALPQFANAKTGNLTDLYNKRYCEIFTVTAPNPPNFQVDVFNTIGLNDCPADKWAAVDYNEVAAQTGALGAKPNGPRRWLIDSIEGGKAGAPLTLSGLEVRQVGVLTVPNLSPAPYTELSIARTTTWVYKKGHNVNYAVSPDGSKYALQAYTTNVDKSLRAKNIPSLATNEGMALPDGWKFKTLKLKKDLRLKAPGVATIMRDPLEGTYQKFTWPKNFFKPVKKHRKHR